MNPQETDPEKPMSVQESSVKVCDSGSLLQVMGTECSSMCMRPFEGGCHYLHYLHHTLASGQTTEKEHSPAIQQKIGLKFY